MGKGQVGRTPVRGQRPRRPLEERVQWDPRGPRGPPHNALQCYLVNRKLVSQLIAPEILIRIKRLGHRIPAPLRIPSNVLVQRNREARERLIILVGRLPEDTNKRSSEGEPLDATTAVNAWAFSL